MQLSLLASAEGNRVLVTDLKSTNGTFIEEEEIEAMVPSDLPLGSEVIFGEALYMTSREASHALSLCQWAAQRLPHPGAIMCLYVAFPPHTMARRLSCTMVV